MNFVYDLFLFHHIAVTFPLNWSHENTFEINLKIYTHSNDHIRRHEYLKKKIHFRIRRKILHRPDDIYKKHAIIVIDYNHI